MKKKIGIITFHRAHNYGAVLQAIALQEVLKEKYEVNIIDYNPEFLVKPYKIFTSKDNSNTILQFFSKKNLLSILTLRSKINRRKKFESFINHKLNLSEEVTEENMCQHFDAYIFGSDQIWNHEITSGINPIYWGNFTTKSGAKKISYAASLGHAKVNINVKESIKNSLNNFYAISVREKEAVNILKEVTNTEIKEVVDPTLLFDSTFWNSHAIKPKIKEKYVLIYQVRDNPNTNLVAKKIAKDIGGVVIEIPAKLSKKSIFDKYAATSPEEFLGLFKYANFIVTTSFHGTAFSIIFNKPFYTLNLEDGSENRAKNLLLNVGLENRMIKKKTNPTFKDVDFTIANSKAVELRKKSLQFLFESIEN